MTSTYAMSNPKDWLKEKLALKDTSTVFQFKVYILIHTTIVMHKLTH